MNLPCDDHGMAIVDKIDLALMAGAIGVDEAHILVKRSLAVHDS